MATRTIAAALSEMIVPINSISLWPDNPRHGDVGAITESLKRFGQLKPVVVQQSTMYIVAGNHLYRAAAALGWAEIAANVVDISDKDAAAFVVADNRMSDLGSYDQEMLGQMLADLASDDNLAGTGYDPDDIDALLADVGRPNRHGMTDPDAHQDLPKETWVKPGQVYSIDRHRIACGEVSDPHVLELLLDGKRPALVIAAPPYEGLTFDASALYAQITDVAEQFWFGADHYRLSLPIDDATGSWLVWDKRVENTDAMFGDAFELVWSRTAHKRDILRHVYAGVGESETKKRGDETARPTALMTDIMERFSKFESIVLDPYATAGATLMAAEKCGRIYYGAKASPHHVQSLLERWSAYTNIEHKLVEEVPV